MKMFLSAKSSIVRILLAFATAVVVLGAILFAAAPPRVARGQNGERPPSSIQGLGGPAPKEEAPAPSVPTSSWTAAPPYPTNINHYAFAQNGEDMYVISGFSDSGFLDTVRRYNATTNVWTSLANIPTGSEGPAGVFFGGKIYVADGSGGAGNAFRIYDIATNTWSAGPPRPGVADSFGAAAGAFNGKVYVAGGYDGGAFSTLLSIYNIGTNTWSAGPAAPSPYVFGGYAQIGQFLYLIGSFTSNTTGVNTTVSMRLDMAVLVNCQLDRTRGGPGAGHLRDALEPACPQAARRTGNQRTLAA